MRDLIQLSNDRMSVSYRESAVGNDLPEINFIFFYFNLFSVPNGSHPFRTLGIGQRPFLEAPFTSHLRDLDFRRKAPPLTTITTSINNTPGGHPLSNGLSSSDCQGYKPNAPQIQGKKMLST